MSLLNRPLPARAEIGPDTPLRLDVAAALAYPDGSMSASGLRREASRGRLVIERVAGKDYTTLAYLKKWHEEYGAFFRRRNFLRFTGRGRIYFIRCESFVKIGFTSGSAERRAATLATGNPFEVELLFDCHGTIAEEQSLHVDFRHLHVRGEWFRADPELLDFIQEQKRLAGAQQ
jgi:hypothetical protein